MERSFGRSEYHLIIISSSQRFSICSIKILQDSRQSAADLNLVGELCLIFIKSFGKWPSGEHTLKGSDKTMAYYTRGSSERKRRAERERKCKHRDQIAALSVNLINKQMSSLAVYESASMREICSFLSFDSLNALFPLHSPAGPLVHSLSALFRCSFLRRGEEQTNSQ